MNRKIMSLVLAICMALSLLAGCERKQTPKQIDDADFIISGAVATEIGNDNALDITQDNNLLIYYYPGIDESREGVIKTARGLVIGDTKEDAKELYGEGTDICGDGFVFSQSEFFSADSGMAEEYVDYLNGIWLCGLKYETDTGDFIIIFFDEADTVSGFIFGTNRETASLDDLVGTPTDLNI